MRWLAVAGLLVVSGCRTVSPSIPVQSQPQPEAAASPGPNTARNATVSWSYTQAGDHPDNVLEQGIRETRTSLNAAVYAINRPVDVQAMADVQTRCTCVRLITDATQAASDPKQTAALAQLKSAGVPIKVDSHAGLMHMKALAVDHAVLYAGSFNLTNAASTINDEVLLRVSSTAATQAFEAEFESMWNDARRFKDWQAPPGTVTPVPALSEF